jgi:hypothetical protein
MANNSEFVTFGKPNNVSGCLYSAPLGTDLPESANDTVDTAFVQLGYLSDAGITDPQSTDDPTSIKAFGGDTVLTVPGEYNKSYEFEFIETLNENVNKEIYGDENVIETEAGYKVIEKNVVLPEKSYVIDFVLKNGKLRRVVVPKATIIRTGDIEYTDDDALKYPATITCIANADGEYAHNFNEDPSVNKSSS